MAIKSKKPSESITQLAIEELKQINELYNKSYDQLRTRVITIMAAEFALLGYLYRDPGEWFIPDNIYGIILYAVGWLCLIVSFTALLLGLNSTTWYYPMEIKDLKKLRYKTTEDFLGEIKDEYLLTIELNTIPYEKKQRLFKFGLYALIMGGIILMAISQIENKGII